VWQNAMTILNGRYGICRAQSRKKGKSFATAPSFISHGFELGSTFLSS
jgi:hypothetical protein